MYILPLQQLQILTELANQTQSCQGIASPLQGEEEFLPLQLGLLQRLAPQPPEA